MARSVLAPWELSEKGHCPVAAQLAGLPPSCVCCSFVSLLTPISKHNNGQGEPGLRKEELGEGPNVQKAWEP